MSSTAMNGTRSAATVVRTIRVVPGSSRTRADQVRRALEARAARQLQVGEVAAAKSSASRSSLPLTVK